MVSTENKIAGCVILYNPSVAVIDNVKSYIEYVTELIVIDNSERYDSIIIDFFTSQNKITYLNNNANLGIAKALNQSCELAQKKNYKWLLTMDQDSSFSSEAIKNLF
ncbi:MAG: glycosyltransferase [Flavobacterium sp.]|nr:MAG: glycosyltransferase [Flavobacterium sp.]